MSVVANSSPLILFAKIGRLDLLQTLYGEVIIPPAVHREVVGAGTDKPGAQALAEAGWITVRPVAGPPPAELASSGLGNGETEAIALAREQSRLLVIDDHAGRAAAAGLGVPITGTSGVLLAARSQGVISSVQPLLDHLVAAGLHMDRRLYHRVLELAGEGTT